MENSELIKKCINVTGYNILNMVKLTYKLFMKGYMYESII